MIDLSGFDVKDGIYDLLWNASQAET